MENSWDLQAVVRGCSNSSDQDLADTMEHPLQLSCFGFAPMTVEENDEIFHAFPRLFEATTAFDELEELYKPFYYPVSQPISPPPTIPAPCVLVPEDATAEEPKKLKSLKEASPMCKRSRKNQSKRVVKEVKEEDLFSDVWAWRKYGQKPIKGSPYPRSYYRCSSSKGCSARKQVERSNSNPDLFIITFTAEHNHVHPTRRNSLAGSTRTKFPKSQIKQKCKNEFAHVKVEAPRLMEEDEVSQESVADKMFEDEVVPSFEDLGLKLEELSELMASEPVMADGFFSDQFSDIYIPSSWFTGHSSSTVTGTC